MKFENIEVCIKIVQTPQKLTWVLKTVLTLRMWKKWTHRTMCTYHRYVAVIHYSDVTWPSWRPKSPAIPLFCQPFVQAYIMENISELCVTDPLWGESNGNAENFPRHDVSIWHWKVTHPVVHQSNYLRSHLHWLDKPDPKMHIFKHFEWNYEIASFQQAPIINANIFGFL